jgi:DNA segregation ATPase FtsK/SpoIIIE, S-DNA-T family
LDVVRLDLFEGPPHLLVLGDAECGKSSLLRLLARALAATHPPEEVALLVVDPRRGLRDLATLPSLAGYACTPAAVAQAVDQLQRDLLDRAPADLDAPAGLDLPLGQPDRVRPRRVVLADDYDLLPAAAGSPLLPLLDLLGLGRELGFHLVLSRRVAGAARAAFEPVFQRLRELGGPGLGHERRPRRGPAPRRPEGVPLPPGRGLFVHPRRPPTLVQAAYSPPPPAGVSRPARQERVGEG